MNADCRDVRRGMSGGGAAVPPRCHPQERAKHASVGIAVPAAIPRTAVRTLVPMRAPAALLRGDDR